MRKSKSLRISRPHIEFFVFLLIMLTSSLAMASGGGGEHGGGGTGWVDTDTYRVMNFAVLAIGLFFLLKKPVSQFLGDRIKGIAEQLDELEEKKRAAEKKLDEYNKMIATLSSEADSIISQYKKQGEDARDKILKAAEAAAEKLEEQSRRSIEYEFKQAKLKLETEVFEKAIAKAEEKLKSKITDQDQDVKRFSNSSNHNYHQLILFVKIFFYFFYSLIRNTSIDSRSIMLFFNSILINSRDTKSKLILGDKAKINFFYNFAFLSSITTLADIQ